VAWLIHAALTSADAAMHRASRGLGERRATGLEAWA
jgi:hypothetical protein